MTNTMQRVAIFFQHPRNLLITAGLLSGGVVCIKSAPHIFPGLVFRPLYQAHTYGEPCELMSNQNQEFLHVCKDLGIKPNEYDVFVSSRLDIMWRGLPWLFSGVKFGIPEILKENPKVSSERFSDPIKSRMNSEEGRKLQKALCLSQNARKFSLGREMILIDKNFPLYSITLAPLLISTNFGLVTILQVTSMIGLPNYVLLLLTCIPFYCMYQLLMSAIRERIDLKVDEQLAGLGPMYKAGGVEYYEQCLQKNTALRILMGKKGERLFTYYGNEKPSGLFGLRNYGAALTQKLNNMKNAMKES